MQQSRLLLTILKQKKIQRSSGVNYASLYYFSSNSPENSTMFVIFYYNYRYERRKRGHDRSIVRDNVYYFRSDYVLSTNDFACNAITDITANILLENSKRVIQFDARCFVFIKRSLPFSPSVRSHFQRWGKSKSIVFDSFNEDRDTRSN